MAASKGIMHHLSMAACEWFLIFLMLFDAALAYLLAKFAHYCDLQSPCIFCLRLDHFFGNLFGHEKPRSYLKLFCHEHRAEVSCLIACDLHGKLADAREMCDDCFMSVMNCRIGTEGYQKPYLNKNFDRRPSSCGLCSCCETEWKPKPKPVRRSQPAAVRLGPAKVTVKPPLPRVTGRGRFRRRNLFKRVRDKILGKSTPCRVVNNARVKMEIDMLSDFGCVRFGSDSECEIPVPKDVQTAEFRFYSDSDSDSDSSSRISVSKNVPRPRKKRGSKDKTQANHGVSDRETSLVDQHHNESTLIFPAPLTSKDPIGHGPKELNHVEHHSRDVFAPSMPEEKLLTSKGSVQDSIGHVELHSRDISAQEKSSTSRGSIQDSIGHIEQHHSENVSAPSLPQENSSIQDSIGQIEHHPRDVSGPSLLQEKSSTSRGPIQDSIGHVEIRSRDVSAPSVPQEKSSTSRGSIQDSIGPVEHHSRDASSPSLPTSTGSIQDSIGHVELHSSDISGHPGSVSDQRKLSTDDLKVDGHNNDERSSPSTGSIQDSKRDLPKFEGFNDHDPSSSSDKSDGFESPAGSVSSVSDIEGETALEKLKRQVEHDRERLHMLHMELEEERNHAAVAADEAMAMITRLQEEKAALHMEALQYLRMMDEQAEYDMEALDKANDLVAEKDKEIQDLEAELDFLRSRYDDEVGTGNFPKTRLGNGKTGFGNSGLDSTPRKGPVLDLQDEKRYILQCLSELERKFNQVSSVGKSNGNIHTEMENLEDLDNGTQSKHKDSSTLNGSKKVDVSTLENEISDLNERLEALEADRDFLEHACNTLQANGGLELIQEISHHLRDMRRIRFDRRCQSVA